MVEVIAIEKGYYGSLRKAGDVFTVEKGVTGSWFVPVKAAEKSKPKQAAKASKADK